MRPLLCFLALAAASGVTASRIPSFNDDYLPRPRDVPSYLEKLVPVAEDVLHYQLGARDTGGDPGVVITVIPEEGRPDYLIYWVRDAALAYYAWIAELEKDSTNTTLRKIVDDAVHAFIRTQHVVSPAGNIFTGGLEEALFDVKIREITNSDYRVGSPSADGPPLRALVFIKYAEWLLRPEQKNGTWVADVLWPAINLDLQWIVQHWNESSWDLWWQPVWAGSYWTSSVQHRVLKSGARLGRTIGRETDIPGYDGVAKLVLDYAQTFWNEEKGFMTETTITNAKTGGRSGYGAAPLTVSVLNFDPTLGCDPVTFQPCSDRALSSLKVVGDAFTKIYPVSQLLPPDQFKYYGFFLEDKLNGGQVQYFASLNVAEQAYDALHTWEILGKLEVTKVSLEFFRQFDKRVKIGSYRKGGITYKKLTSGIKKWADNTVLSIADRTPDDYILPLGFNKTTGLPEPPRGALRSQVAVLGLNNAYHNVIPPSWANGGKGSWKRPLESSNVKGGDCHGSADDYDRDESQFNFEF